MSGRWMAGAGKRRFNRTEKPRAGKKELAKWEAIKERGPATSLPSLRLLRMTAFGTSRCRPPRCHVAAVSSDRGKNHDPAGTEAASHWSVTPCSPPSRPGRCAVGAGAPSLDRRCARCPGDGWPGQENGASTEQKNRGQAKKSLQSGRRLKNEVSHFCS